VVHNQLDRITTSSSYSPKNPKKIAVRLSDFSPKFDLAATIVTLGGARRRR
jgi:hypothetical protein